ncbi:CDP-alcohol phosphatidyltransferase family protein [Candidatus Acetothermia bacterium]|jgi:cardiolipin synthase|nr:CDP-alcohol phosphatidyltransferase family protein [Candidatus Acetothermia bacterium]MCI2426592.1 CDP-alcohol phosphatidyltransferase family protein [Candidatus Acetothermia bacterium]MCI2427242.1 CDP-alcohol phosphatidyltransferase family protein [Candidatus Acetothermia bacterium]MCI2428754.1 CDP-alcohol phosphatidyltransferase family protein [Candidatus Acetothermia bacterium]
MNLANTITILRGLLIPVVIYFLFLDKREMALAVFLLICISDSLDGIIARRRNTITTLGTILDPAVDKLLYISVLTTLAVVTNDIPVVLLILYAIPHIILAVGAVVLYRTQRPAIAARFSGKAAAWVIIGGISFIFMQWPYGLLLLSIGIGLSYIATLHYAQVFRRMHRD